MKRIIIGALVVITVATFVAAVVDFYNPTSATAPNGEPIGAQHPRSERP